ncbi:MAG: type IV secretion system DNA-binding domain-containing protein [Acidobacteriota bacterium]|nr:type IV secretion system DNA-binding domain-containing protein [Acidobacteriota bacterium]
MPTRAWSVRIILMGESLTYLGRIHWRDKRRPFGIHAGDRLAHTYVLGKTGTGKSSLLEFLARQDLASTNGLALFDPHGDLVERLHGWSREQGRTDVVYLNVPDANQPFSFNPLANVPPLRRSLAAAGLIEALKKMFSEAWGVRMEHFLRYALLLLLDQPSATIADIPRLFTEPDFRKAAIEHAVHEPVQKFWTAEFPSYPIRTRMEAVAPVMNKLGAFLADPFLHRILASPTSTFNLRELMDERGVLLVNIAKGRIGEGPAAAFGALLMASIGIAGLSRSEVPEEQRRPFYVYGDEFQTYTTLAIANMLAELRKYGVGMILANQYLGQVDDEVRSAIMGNVGTLVAFRVGAEDAAKLAKEFRPEFDPDDLISLPNRQFCVRMLVRGEFVRPFSGRTIDVANACETARYLRPDRSGQFHVRRNGLNEDEGVAPLR